MPAAVAPPDASGVLVCGLGRLGQHSVAALKLFGVPVHGVDVRAREQWEIADFPSLLSSFSLGDCRAAEVLQKAHIGRCRAVLLVTRDERINIAAAFAVRSLHPDIRIVIRSAQKNLNDLLAGHLGNFVAYEPSDLSAPAFALAALGDDTGLETDGLFRLLVRLMRVVGVTVTKQHPWCARVLSEPNTSRRRVVGFQSSGETAAGGRCFFGRRSPASNLPTSSGYYRVCRRTRRERAGLWRRASASSEHRDERERPGGRTRSRR